MSDTPRTDEVEDKVFFLVDADFARHIERENNELRAYNDRMFKINEALLAQNANISDALRKAGKMIGMLERVAPFTAVPGDYPMDGLREINAVLASYAAQSE